MSSTAFCSLEGKSALVTGASRGIGRAIAFELARAGASRIALYNRSQEKGEALLRGVTKAFPATAAACVAATPPDCDIAINATSLGLRPDDPLPFAIDALPAHAAVAEVVMQPLMTRLLRAAQARGLRIVTGDGMLTAQLPFWMDFVGFDGSRADDTAAHREAATDR